MVDLDAILAAWHETFNRGDLDGVMTYFAPDAVYCPGDGKEHRGVTAIRAAFAPQFAGRFGHMRFDLEDQLIDRQARKATTRWICRHDLRDARNMPAWLRLPILARFGARVAWRGVDVFHFDAAGKLTGKFTYANYGRPRLYRDR